MRAAGARWAVSASLGLLRADGSWATLRRGGILLAAALTLLAGGGGSATAQNGSLAGNLTDIHSKPLAGAVVVLRNARTGWESRGTTRKNGAYRFGDIAPGEYTLIAALPDSGTGQLEGIVVSSGHESRVQAAIELNRQALVDPARVRADDGPVPSLPAAELLAGLVRVGAEKQRPEPERAALDARLSSEPAVALRLAARNAAQPVAEGTPGRTAPAAEQPRQGAGSDAVSAGRPQVISNEKTTVEVAKAEPGVVALSAGMAGPGAADLAALGASFGAVPGGLRGRVPGMALAVSGALAALQVKESIPQRILAESATVSTAEGVSVTGDQMQELPIAGRNWAEFGLDADVREDQDRPQAASRRNMNARLDGAGSGLAFSRRMGVGGRGSSQMSAGMPESAVGEVKNASRFEGGDSEGSADLTHVETRRGGQGLHGNGFLYDRQNLWGAQNPFTQWSKETAPATLTTVPVFTPLPYTAPNRHLTWGMGAGGAVRGKKLYWFGAVDGSETNDPAVSTVKHPDQFFAQPSNDELQVLSARLGLSSLNPVAEGLAAYSGMLEQLSGLLGPAPRTAAKWAGFARLDWDGAERHRFSLEGSGGRSDSPGGGLSRVSETFGTHSFGISRASKEFLLGRWEAFLSPNLLATTQGSASRQILAEGPEAPSPYEQGLNVGPWGQLPQIVVDSRYGFTLGNPARFGGGSYPDEHQYEAQESLAWVRHNVLVRAGASVRHNVDATNLVRNHTGTYNYASVEDFVSDALVFAKFGLTNALDPYDQHNCDQRGRAWRDGTGQLHGLGYLPCYTYYSQMMGPTNWFLSTNDWAGYATAQWEAGRQLVLSAGLRWEHQELPPAIALVNNPDLPMAGKLPALGNEWAPRASLAWGSHEGHWPVVRLGYGMYFSRTQNAVAETALTQTGSTKGDLYFFLRPTDDLAKGGAPPFPYVLAGEPSTVVKPGAVEFGSNFKNGEIHQGELTLEEKLPGHVDVAASAAVSLGRRLPITVDTNFDPAVNPGTITYDVVDASGKGPLKTGRMTVPFFASWTSPGSAGAADGRLNSNYQQISAMESRANSTYEAATLRVSRTARRGWSVNARYTYAHAMDWNPNESAQVAGSSMLDPTNLSEEYGTSDLDVRHSASGSLVWHAPWKAKSLVGQLANGWMMSGIGRFQSGLPYTMRTAGSVTREFDSSGVATVGLGTGMNGSGGDDRVYGVGRNTYRYPQTWKLDLRIAKKWNLGQMRELELLAESFNLFNHQNVTRIETTGYYIRSGGANGSLPTLNFLTGLKAGQTEFGKPLDVNATDFYRPRQIDFGMRVRF